MKRSFAILGLGVFGTALAKKLRSDGHYVLVVDISRSKIEAIKDKVSEAIIADVSNENVIKELEIAKFDTIFLGMSKFFEKAILAMTMLTQEKAKYVIAKAQNDIQKQILEKLGANEVIQPDIDMAFRLSRRLSMPHIEDMFEFKGSSIATVTVKDDMNNRSIRDIDFRKRFNITVVLYRSKDSLDAHPVWDPDIVLLTGDELTVIGREDDIMKAFNG